jgi:hypothetical protein
MFTLFEIWTEDEEGRQELIDTTASHTEAIQLAEKTVIEGAFAAFVLRETEDGDLEEIERFISD